MKFIGTIQNSISLFTRLEYAQEQTKFKFMTDQSRNFRLEALKNCQNTYYVTLFRVYSKLHASAMKEALK